MITEFTEHRLRLRIRQKNESIYCLQDLETPQVTKRSQISPYKRPQESSSTYDNNSHIGKMSLQENKRSFAKAFTKRRFFTKLQKFLQGMLGLQEEFLREELRRIGRSTDGSPPITMAYNPLFIQQNVPKLGYNHFF